LSECLAFLPLYFFMVVRSSSAKLMYLSIVLWHRVCSVVTRVTHKVMVS